MKYMFSLVFCFFCFTGFSQTQAEMNMMQYESYKKADKKLNEVYQAILKEYKSDAEFIKNLRASQRIWITFRDAEVKVKFPDREAGYYGGIDTGSGIYPIPMDKRSSRRRWLFRINQGQQLLIGYNFYPFFSREDPPRRTGAKN